MRLLNLKTGSLNLNGNRRVCTFQMAPLSGELLARSVALSTLKDLTSERTRKKWKLFGCLKTFAAVDLCLPAAGPRVKKKSAARGTVRLETSVFETTGYVWTYIAAAPPL